MKNKVSIDASHLLIRAIQFLFVLCSAFVFSQIMFANSCYKTDMSVAIPAMLILACIFGCVWFVLRKYEITDERINLITAIFLACFGIVQMTIASKLEYNPVYDLGSVYHGAVEWLESGTVATYEEYFYYFPNNIGLTVIFRALFGIAKLVGIKEYFLVGALAGCINSLAMMWAVIQICRKLLDNKMALLSMVLMALVPPFYLMAAVFYTDVMTISAIPLVIYFYLKAEEQTTTKKKVMWFAILAVVAVFGMKVKFTVLIGLIALGIIVAVRKKWKELLMLAVSIGIVTGIVYPAFHAVVYPDLLSEETAEQMNTPYLHWIMMGLQGKGSYHHGDYEFTRSFDDLDERQDALLEEIQNRIKQKGVSGMLDLYRAKTSNCFGDGTFGMADFLDDSPVNQANLHDWVLYSGEKYRTYSSVCQGMFLFIMLCMFIGSVRTVFFEEYDWIEMSIEEKKQIANKTLCMLAFIGIWMFLMLWETSSRYFLNHISVMIICAVFGLESVIVSLEQIKNKKEKKNGRKEITKRDDGC